VLALLSRSRGLSTLVGYVLNDIEFLALDIRQALVEESDERLFTHGRYPRRAVVPRGTYEKGSESHPI